MESLDAKGVILPGSVEFNEGDAGGDGLVKVLFRQGQHFGLRRKRRNITDLILLVAKAGLNFSFSHLLLLFRRCGDLVIRLLLARLLLLLGCVGLQLIVHKVFERVQVSLSLVLVSLQKKQNNNK